MLFHPDTTLETLLAIARRAAVVVLDVYRTDFSVDYKGKNDPVTEADRRANALIVSALKDAFPGAAVLAEESVPTDPNDVRVLLDQHQVFFVDPVDGTKEFAARNDEFCIMIGAAVDGRPTHGVVLAPTTGVALCGQTTGASEQFAFAESQDGVRRPISVSNVSDGSRARLMVSRSHRPELIDPVIRALGIATEIPRGSVGLKVAALSTSDADIYIHGRRGTKLWDSCAPEAILRGAGGRMTDLMGDPLNYRNEDLRLSRGIVATNSLLHDRILHALAETDGQ